MGDEGITFLDLVRKGAQERKQRFIIKHYRRTNFALANWN